MKFDWFYMKLDYFPLKYDYFPLKYDYFVKEQRPRVKINYRVMQKVL